jgi:tetratricopeptide (TPR) repeat protein
MKRPPALNPEILAAQQEAEEAVTSAAAWQKLEQLVKSEVSQHPERAGGYLPLLLQALEQLKTLEPGSADRLVELADLHFQIREFPKSSGYYREALALEPENSSISARLASSLSFEQNYDEAIAILQGVLKREPNHFQARAYLAIAYSQKGEKDDAIREGEQALQHAPSDEARARFGRFLDSMKSEPSSDRSEPGFKKPTDSSLSGGAVALIAHVRSSQIAGPKLFGAQQEGAVLTLSFKEFPMEKMPPFAKEKFLNGLREFARKGDIKDVRSIRFIDEESGVEMENLPLE